MNRPSLGKQPTRLLGWLLIAAIAAALLLSEGCGSGGGASSGPMQMKWNKGKWNQALWG